jgi:hypothetical protein
VEATENLRRLIEDDVQMNFPFEAFEKFDALQQELCNVTYDPKLADAIAGKMIEHLGEVSDSDELIDGVYYLSSILNSCSPTILPEILHAIEAARMGMKLNQNNIHTLARRQKRNTDLLSAMSASGEATESVANTLLVAYDLLVSKNQNVVAVYLSNLIDLLSGFCLQTDSTRIMAAAGQNYTTIQLQGLIPSYKSFLSSDYSLAGTTGNTVCLSLIL